MALGQMFDTVDKVQRMTLTSVNKHIHDFTIYIQLFSPYSSIASMESNVLPFSHLKALVSKFDITVKKKINKK